MSTRQLLLGRFPDPERSSDPRVEALLRSLPALPSAALAARISVPDCVPDELAREFAAVTAAPRPEFRSELRAQLVAITPRVVAESTAEDAQELEAGRPRRAGAGLPVRLPAATGRLRPTSVVHAALVAVTTTCALAILTAILVVMSGSALPGDHLYRVKRTAEDVRLALASGDTATARQYLHMAQNRAGEAQDLADRDTAMGPVLELQAAGLLSDHTVRLIEQTLHDADDETRHASKLLTSAAVRQRNPAVLEIMTSWAPQQAQRLAAVVGRLPAGTARAQANQSLTLVEQARTRSSGLSAVLHEPCLASAPTDALGPVVCGTPGTTPTTGGTPSGPGASSGPTTVVPPPSSTLTPPSSGTQPTTPPAATPPPTGTGTATSGTGNGTGTGTSGTGTGAGVPAPDGGSAGRTAGTDVTPPAPDPAPVVDPAPPIDPPAADPVPPVDAGPPVGAGPPVDAGLAVDPLPTAAPTDTPAPAGPGSTGNSGSSGSSADATGGQDDSTPTTLDQPVASDPTPEPVPAPDPPQTAAPGTSSDTAASDTTPVDTSAADGASSTSAPADPPVGSG